MQVETELAKFSPSRDMLLTIGVFDGVHLGHKHLIARLLELARQQGLDSGAVTFREHPQMVLSQQGLTFLASLDQRLERLRGEGIDLVVALSFSRKLADLSPRRFLSLLQQHLSMRGLVVGPDFALGRGREGDSRTLTKLGEEMGFSVTVVPPLTIDGEVVSSTAIRRALEAGDMKKVEKLAGRPFSITSKVVSGAGRGAELLGFPTANLGTCPQQALPADGVYVSQALVDGQTHAAVTNIGYDPTFNGSERTVEVYIINYQQPLYGRELTVDVIARLRGERKFGSPEELKKQIAEDIAQGKTILTKRGR